MVQALFLHRVPEAHQPPPTPKRCSGLVGTPALLPYLTLPLDEPWLTGEVEFTEVPELLTTHVQVHCVDTHGFLILAVLARVAHVLEESTVGVFLVIGWVRYGHFGTPLAAFLTKQGLLGRFK